MISLHLGITYQEMVPGVNGTGAKRSAQILFMGKSDEQINTQGFQLGMGWTIAAEDPVRGHTTVFRFKGDGQAHVFHEVRPCRAIAQRFVRFATLKS